MDRETSPGAWQRVPIALRGAFLATVVFAWVVPGGSLAARAPERGPELQRAIAELEARIEGKEDRPAKEVFDNIELLQGGSRPWTVKRVMSVMTEKFPRELGVDCDYCHVVGDWASDEKAAKRIVPLMWGMVGDVFRTLEEARPRTFGVSCYTCHRGEPRPKVVPPR